MIQEPDAMTTVVMSGRQDVLSPLSTESHHVIQLQHIGGMKPMHTSDSVGNGLKDSSQLTPAGSLRGSNQIKGGGMKKLTKLRGSFTVAEAVKPDSQFLHLPTIK